MISATYSKYNPFRTPEWRADRAMALAGAQPRRQRASRHDDPYVRDYAKFLSRYLPAAEADDEAAKMLLFSQNAGMYYAQEIHYQEDYEWRTIIQARLLTGEPFDKIAGYLGTLPEAVCWYECLFFNVIDRLKCHDWIVKSILGTAMDRTANREGTLTEHQRNLTYKLFGYFGGPLVLNTIISGFSGGTLPKSVDEISGWFDRTVKDLLRSRAAQAARVFEVNKYNVMQLFELHLGIINSDLQAKAQKDGPTSPIVDNVKAMLSMAPWQIAQDHSTEKTEAQRHYSLTAVEPTWQEDYALEHGVVPESLANREAAHARGLVVVGGSE